MNSQTLKNLIEHDASEKLIGKIKSFIFSLNNQQNMSASPIGKRRKWKKWLIIPFLFILLFVYIFFKLFTTSNNVLSTTHALSHDDSALIAPEYFPDLSVNKVVYLRDRNPISYLYYKPHFYLIITKLNLTGNISLQKMLTIKKTTNESMSWKFYMEYAIHDYTHFQLLDGEIAPVSQLTMDIDAQAIHADTISQNMIVISAVCKQFGIRPSTSLSPYIHVKKKPNGDESPLIPMQLLFYTHRQSVYLFMLTADGDHSIPAGTLTKMIHGDTK